MPASSTAPRTVTGPILVGVGPDGRSDHAVQRGAQLARLLDTTVEYVHSVPELTLHGKDTPGARRGAVNGQRLGAARRHVAAHLDSLPVGGGVAAVGPALSEQLRVLPGKPAQVLLERVRELEAGLLVLGPHRRRGFVDFGTTARAVLSHAPCAVWTQVEGPRDIRRVLVPVDLSDASQRALQAGLELARLFDASVTVLYCFVGPDFAYPPQPDPTTPTYVVDEQRRLAHAELDEFVQRQAWGEVEHRGAFFEDEPTTRILNMQAPDDLIVMATHGRGAFSAAVLGSVTYTVLREAHVPVLAIPANIPPP